MSRKSGRSFSEGLIHVHVSAARVDLDFTVSPDWFGRVLTFQVLVVEAHIRWIFTRFPAARTCMACPQGFAYLHTFSFLDNTFSCFSRATRSVDRSPA